jgi:hypothetical protein
MSDATIHERPTEDLPPDPEEVGSQEVEVSPEMKEAIARAARDLADPLGAALRAAGHRFVSLAPGQQLEGYIKDMSVADGILIDQLVKIAYFLEKLVVETQGIKKVGEQLITEMFHTQK